MAWNRHKVKNDLSEVLMDEIVGWAETSIKEKGVFRIGLSGGSVVNHVCSMLLHPEMRTDLSKWRFFFCDERYVPESDENSNFGQYKDKLIVPNSPIKLEQFFPVNTGLPIQKAAEDYEKTIRTEFGVTSDEIPKFDCIILGIGTDGHTCSLFPDHKLLYDYTKLIAYLEDSPKPPPKRITMTFRLLNQAHAACVFATGEEKQDIAIRMVLGDSIPINHLHIDKLVRIFDIKTSRRIKESMKIGESIPASELPLKKKDFRYLGLLITLHEGEKYLVIRRRDKKEIAQINHSYTATSD